MRVGIAGAGKVGRSVAQELLDGGHKVLLIERERDDFEPNSVPAADWLHGDACELSTLQEAGAQTCDVVIAATGEDKANLVVGLLAKTEFGVPRVVARINDLRNEWLFGQSWGIDVAVSTPGAMVAGIEGAIDVGHLVRMMGLREGRAALTKLTLPSDNPLVGKRVSELELPSNTALVSVLRGDAVRVPQPDDTLEPGDELLFIADSFLERSVWAAVYSTMPSRAPVGLAGRPSGLRNRRG
ncbi:TrkA family potassium uptake protein [Mycobacterium ulcerans]|uniref:Trk system potassium uptake protein TrkA n=3 Tax=Mycobacterium ulcerans TaxID=1809 RepID=A0PSS7_MYCUA|nr:TrkA family potassium uptake protein [Mycobacterium ulcerans]EUA88432.1 trkA-C domain protein [Mycobacterium ulcerans str. Harvey]ABL05396.1 TRK system potassium uptake protein CeoC1 [Mycobacterium ulcerans Agy99]MEB3905426.1 TrkA family potassium uptake protein [Mycobacterium ulcerans]MEB3909650.1 TrkA family potassium uptake protein [Mycobacterium ulcerans]MEB3919887.1 TrkA family potassium uptake protein [Mycobacterium ulcerans]